MPDARPSQTELPPAFDPLSKAFARDPYPAYAALRKMDQPCFYPANESWLLSRYTDVDQAARDPRLVRSLECFMDPAEIAERKRAKHRERMATDPAYAERKRAAGRRTDAKRPHWRKRRQTSKAQSDLFEPEYRNRPHQIA